MRDPAKHTPTYLDPYRAGLFCRSQQRYEEAIQWFKKGINLDPSYGHIVAICYNTLKTYQDRVEFLNELVKNNRTPKGFIAMSKMMNRNRSEEGINKEINRWKTHDIAKIIKICTENRIKIILQGYPQEKTINDMLCDIAKANSFPFVDNYRIFNELWKKGEKREDYFSADGHCNAKGYALMARNIFDKIRQETVF